MAYAYRPHDERGRARAACAWLQVRGDLIGKGFMRPRRMSNGGVCFSASAYHAVDVAASAMPCDSSQRSASIAALQPSAAAVTAWR